MTDKRSETLRKLLIEAARQAEAPAVRTQGFEQRVLARLAARQEDSSALPLLGWAALRLAPGFAVILLVMSAVGLVPQSNDWADAVSTMLTYLILGGGL